MLCGERGPGIKKVVSKAYNSVEPTEGGTQERPRGVTMWREDLGCPHFLLEIPKSEKIKEEKWLRNGRACYILNRSDRLTQSQAALKAC